MAEKFKSGLSFKLLKKSSKLSKHYDNKISLCRRRSLLAMKRAEHDFLISHHSNCTSYEKEKTLTIYKNNCFRCAKAHRTQVPPGFLSCLTKTLLCVRCRASLTAEAALAVPIFVFLLVLFLGFFQVQMIEIRVHQALSYTVSQLAVNTGTNGEECFAGRIIFLNHLQSQGASESEFVDGWRGIRIENLGSDKEYVCMTVHYNAKLPINIFGKQFVPVSQRAVARRWIGYLGGTDSENQWVYITPFGTAYHLRKDCPYLDLSLRAVQEWEVSSLRNQSGGRYYECSVCQRVSYEPDLETVYVTDYGIYYHWSLSCSRIRRTIHRVNIEEVGGRTLCQKCN